MDTLIGQWQDVCTALKDRLGEGVADRWLSKITPHAVEGGRVCLTVSSPCVCEMIQQNFADPILSAWHSHNPAIETVSISVRATEKASQPPLVVPTVAEAPTAAPTIVPEADAADIPCRLNPHYTFDTFVVGNTNQFAYAAAQKIAEDDSAVFNPLYIHSAVGLGKTHLMQAIAWRMKETFPDKTVLYVSSEEFFHRFIKAIRTNAGTHFSEQFRSVDVLMIDDLQFIVGKNRTQEEFFHTFNHLIAMGKKIVLSSDAALADLQGIEDRLRTRIAQGLVVNIQPPSYELRLAILQDKMERMNVSVPREVLAFLADKISSSVRELEGALKRLVAHAQLIGTEITMETTREVLKDILNIRDVKVSVPMIQDAVMKHYALSVTELKGKQRDRRIARPRQLAMYLAKTLTPLSLPDIGAHFGRDHTTVIHAVKQTENLMSRDAALMREVKSMIVRLKSGDVRES